MPNVLIRNVSPETHRRLIEQARSRGQSLQMYLRTEFIHIADEPDVEFLARVGEGRRSAREIFAEAEARADGDFGFDETVEALDEVRGERQDSA